MNTEHQDIFVLPKIQLPEIDITNQIWITSYGKGIYVRKMTSLHIQKCINCWNGKGDMFIPSDYLGGKEKWVKIFNQELLNRQ